MTDLDELCDCGEPDCARVNRIILNLERVMRDKLGEPVTVAP